jgi:hypothetical protein
MSVGGYGNNGIVTDGLVFSVDPYNTKSYVSGGTTCNTLINGYTGGTLNNGVGFDVNSWTFDGTNQSISFGDVLNMGTDSFTITSWVKISSGGAGLTRTVLAKRFGSGTFVGYQLRCNTNGTFGVYIDGGTPAANRQSSTNLEDDSWHYICAVIDRGVGDEILFYIDGELDTTGTSASSPSLIGNIDNSAGLYIGEMDGIHLLFGDVSHTSIYRQVLTPEQIKQNYNVLKWRFR